MDLFHGFICKVVVAIVNPAMLLLSAAAFVYFLWGVAQLIITMTQGEEAGDGKKAMLWGIIGLAIIFGAYGIVNLATGTADGIFGSSIGPYSGPGCSAGAPSASTSRSTTNTIF